MQKEMENAAMEPQEAQMRNETIFSASNPVGEQKNAAPQNGQRKIRNNRLLMKLGIIGLLSVLLLIPQQFILRLINERNLLESRNRGEPTLEQSPTNHRPGDSHSEQKQTRK